jgi:3',5'-cyclic AMP phosphodiesterase CpdA
MLLLHISDIHFRAPECTQENDPSRAYRTRMIQDAKGRARALGGVDAILVSGDIAFRGVQSEYAAASMWLEQLDEAATRRKRRFCRRVEVKM